MAPWYSMPNNREAAVTASLRENLRAARCAVALLARGRRTTRDAVLLKAVRRMLREAERALRDFPSRTST